MTFTPGRALADRPILELAPRLGSRPFVPLVAPTAVEPLVVGALGRDGRVWVKRDDRSSPIYGGNKVRRWEWLLGDARARGASTLVTVGGLGSTQVVSLAAHGTREGFRVQAVLYDQEDAPFVRRAQRAARRFGASLVHGGGYAAAAVRTVGLLARTRDAYFVPPGAMGALANLSYVDALLELDDQVRAGLAPRPDLLVVACGSGGTASALALGAAWLGWETEVVAVRITEPIASNALTLRAQISRTEDLLRVSGAPRRKGALRVRVEPRFTGPGYGAATAEARRGARLFEQAFGAPGECTYSGKALAALARITEERRRSTILFWNTLSTTGRDGPGTTGPGAD